MAEAITVLGKKKEREASDITDMVLEKIMDEQDPTPMELKEEDFPFNHVGLTSAEAEELLQKYGKNELPEKVTPKWLLFLQQVSCCFCYFGGYIYKCGSFCNIRC